MTFMRRLSTFILVTALLAVPLALVIHAQDTQGTVRFGRVVLGFGTDGAATLTNTKVSLTNAQVLALNDTAITIIPAPGAGLVVDVIRGVLIFDYTGAYTESANNLRLYHTNRQTGPAASSLMEMTGFIDATADTILAFTGSPQDTLLTANTAVVIQGDTTVAFGGGNASNAVDVDVTYVIRRTGL